MTQDAQGQHLSGASTKAAGFIDEAVRAFTLNYGDPNTFLSMAEEDSPECRIAELIRVWPLTLSNDPDLLASARERVAKIDKGGMNEREIAHLEALRLASKSRWKSAVAILDRHLMHYPLDLVAHQSAMRLDNFQGRFHRAAGRSVRALPSWSKSQPGYGIILSFYGFGLEEAGDYAHSEEITHTAAELEPYGYWPQHTLSHVLEMTGRPEEGLVWMESREPFWSAPDNNNRVHIWWHKSLFHLELGQFDAALSLYENEIADTLRPIGTSLCNPTALLWRLEMLGCEAGARWEPLYALWQDRANGRTSPFNDIHLGMTALRAEERDAYKTLLDTTRGTAAGDSENAPAYRAIVVPVLEAIAHFTDGEYAEAVERLLPIRPDLWRMGGSVAQRDIVEWTLTEAAARAGLSDVVRSLANERLALRPNSKVNKAFFEAA